jgi:hypothetical protein
MNPVFVTAEGVVLDFTKPKTPTPKVEVREVEETFHIKAALEAAKQSTPLRK